MKIKNIISFLAIFYASQTISSPVTERPWEKFLKGEREKIGYPEIKTLELNNGIKVHYIQNDVLPQVHFSIYIEGGYPEELPEQIGLTQIWGNSITYSGSNEYDRDKLSGILDQRASSFSFSNGVERAAFHLSSLSGFFESDLEIILQVLDQPLFEPNDIELLKKKTIQSILKRKESPAKLAHIVANKIFWGENIRGRVSTQETIQSIQRESLQKWHQVMWDTSRMTIAIAGKFDIEKVKILLEKKISAKENKTPFDLQSILEVSSYTSPKPDHIYLVPKELPQSTLIWQASGIPHHSKEYFALKIFNFILGGDSFNSVLTQEIRVKKGWAYVVYSTYSSDKYGGKIKIFAQSQNKNIPDLIAKVEDILKHPQKIVTPKAVQQAKKSIHNKFVFLYRTHLDYLKTKLSLAWDGLAEDYLKNYLDNIQNTSQADVIEMVEKYYSPQKFSLVMIGPENIQHSKKVKKFDINVLE